MEDKHLEVLKMLEKDAFIKPEQAGKQLGLSADEVSSIISQLEQSKIIRGYKAVIDKEQVFADKVFAVIEVSVLPERDSGFDKISERIYKFPEVRSLYLMSGGYDLLIIIEGDTLREVAEFVGSKLSTIERVRHTATHFMLKRYKEDGVIFAETEKTHRLKVAP